MSYSGADGTHMQSENLDNFGESLCFGDFKKSSCFLPVVRRQFLMSCYIEYSPVREVI